MTTLREVTKVVEAHTLRLDHIVHLQVGFNVSVVGFIPTPPPTPTPTPTYQIYISHTPNPRDCILPLRVSPLTDDNRLEYDPSLWSPVGVTVCGAVLLQGRLEIPRHAFPTLQSQELRPQ